MASCRLRNGSNAGGCVRQFERADDKAVAPQEVAHGEKQACSLACIHTHIVGDHIECWRWSSNFFQVGLGIAAIVCQVGRRTRRGSSLAGSTATTRKPASSSSRVQPPGAAPRSSARPRVGRETPKISSASSNLNSARLICSGVCAKWRIPPGQALRFSRASEMPV